jgi:hypothetical protein
MCLKERLEPIRDAAVQRGVQVLERPRPEDGPDHRRVLRERLLLRRQLVEARPDQRLEACRHRQRLAVAFGRRGAGLEHPHGLLEEERVAAGIAEERPERAFRKLVSTEQLGDERGAVRLVERVELEHARAREELALGFGEFRPGRHEEEQRPAAAREEGDQLEERRLGPVQILEHERDRPLRCEQLEQSPDAPVQLRLTDLTDGVGAARRRRNADERGESSRDRAKLVRSIGTQALEQGPELAGHDRRRVVAHDPGDRLHDLADGPVRDALSV